jgi:hypothetical protein
MISKIIMSLLFAAAYFTSAPANAKAAKPNAAGVLQLETAPTSLRADKAYVLMRVSTAKSGMFPIQNVFLRIPSQKEIDDYLAARQAEYEKALPKLKKEAKGDAVPTVEQFGFNYSGTPNSFVAISKRFLEDGEMRTLLLELQPAEYVLYGITMGDRGVVTCNCLGTVSFSAKSGVITDIGSLYADKVHKDSPLPHLEDNLGEQMFQYGLIFGAALVPADTNSKQPTSLAGLPIKPADFKIVEQFYDSGVGVINRLAPIDGLLGYRKGKPVDLRVKESGAN